jgi:hypothetical protein
MSKVCGSRYTWGSRQAAISSGITVEPAGITWPPTSMSSTVTRQMACADPE